MRHAIVAASVLVLLGLVGLNLTTHAAPAASQPATTTASKPAATFHGQDILKRVPAGCMGFVVINNLQDASDKATDTSKKLAGPLGGMGALGKGLLGEAKDGIGLGKGFRDDDALAIVMLDPQLYGYDLVSDMAGPGPAAPPDGQANKQKPPIVFIVPGTDAEKVFTEAAAATKGEFTELTKDEQVSWARKSGNYLVVGENKAAVEAAATMDKSVLDQLTAGEKEMLKHDDAMVWGNFKVLGPILDAAFNRLTAKAAESDQISTSNRWSFYGDPMPTMMMALMNSRDNLAQLSSLAYGVRMEDEALKLDARCCYQAESSFGKILLAFKPGAVKLLDGLPKLPAIFALGLLTEPKQSEADFTKQLNRALAALAQTGVTPAQRDKIKELALKFHTQLQAADLFVGTTQDKGGSLGGSIVLHCTSSADTRTAIRDAVELLRGIAKDQLKDKAESEKAGYPELKITPESETVDGRKVDAIELVAPKTSDSEFREMKAVLGEDRIRLLVDAVDDKTLVLTLGGGGVSFSATAAKAAKSGGGLTGDENVAKAIADFPKDAAALGVFDTQYLMRFISEVAVATGGRKLPPIPGKVPPIAFAVHVEGPEIAVRVVVPHQSIHTIVTAMFGRMMMPAAAANDDGGEDETDTQPADEEDGF
jgi:hypothetical protein